MSEKAPIDFSNKTIYLKKLGLFIDGWAELVEGYGDKITEAQALIYQYLTEREMPEVTIENITGTVGILKQSKRNFTITETYPGATTTIYVGKHGKDLYVSWYTYIKPILNKQALIIILVVSFLFGGIPGFAIAASGLAAGTSELIRNFDLLSIPMTMLFSLGCCIPNVLFTVIIVAFLTMVVSFIIKGHPLALLIIEPNIFDADDIVAMSLSAHRSVLRALDTVGINTALLRKKEEFSRKRGEVV